MRLALVIPLLLFSVFGYSATISLEHEVNSSAEVYEVSSIVKIDGSINFAKISIEIPDGIALEMSDESEFPLQKGENGYNVYVYVIPPTGEIKLKYALTKPSSEKELKYSIRFSEGEDRFEQGLTGLKVDGSTYSMVENDAEAIVLRTEKPEPVAVTKSVPLAEGQVFSVQVIALQEYSDAALKAFCKEYDIDKRKLIQTKSGNYIKFSLGKFSDKNKALSELNRLKAITGLPDLFLSRIAE